MTDTDDGMTAIKVQLLLTFVVPHLTALSFDNIDVKKGVNIE